MPPIKAKRGQVFVTCPECEASFPVDKRTDPLPRHRAFRGDGACAGSKRPVNQNRISHLEGS